MDCLIKLLIDWLPSGLIDDKLTDFAWWLTDALIYKMADQLTY